MARPITLPLPIRSPGDMIYGDLSGLVTRLPIGLDGYSLVVRGGLPVWISGGLFNTRSYGDVTISSSPTPSQRAANTTIVQSAINDAEAYGGSVFCSWTGEVGVNSLEVDSPAVNIFGLGMGVTTISTNSGDLITLGPGGTGRSYFFSCSDISLISRTGGGHIFHTPTNISGAIWNRVEATQQNDAKSVYYHPGTATLAADGVTVVNSWDYLSCRWVDCFVRPSQTATIAAFYIRSNAPNDSTWEGGRYYGGGYYIWDISPNNSTYANNNIWRNLEVEFPNGGAIKMAAARSCLLDGFAMYDFATIGGGAITRDLISIEAAGSGTKSGDISLRHVKRLDGTLNAGKYDVKVVTNTATANVSLYQCGYVSAANFHVDLNFIRASAYDCPYITWYNNTGLVRFGSEFGIEGVRIGTTKQYVPVFHVDACGAAGDGTTDDQAAVQTAYTAASSAGGGKVVWGSAKTYIIGSSVTVSANTTTDFNGATVKSKPGVVGFNMFVSGSVSSVKYKNGTIDLNKANTTDPASINIGIGVYFACTSGNSTGNVVENLSVINGHQVGVRMQGHNLGSTPSSMNPSEITVKDSSITGCKYAIYLTRVSNYRVYANRIDDCADAGITLNFHRDGTISQNLVEDTTSHGIVCVYGIGYTISSNVVRRAGVSGICNGGGSYTSAETNRYYTVTGNVCEACTAHGITNDPTITSGTFELTCATITGNVCRDNGSHGIYVQNVKRITVTGNECMDNTNSGIANFGSYHTIVGNHCYDNGAYGIDVQGASGGDAEGYHTIHSNNLHGNATADITFSQYLTDVDGATGSKSHDWPDLVTNAEQTTTVTVYGAVLGMSAEASMSISLGGTKLFAYVSAANTVTVVQRNDTGGNVNLASATLRATVRRIN